MSSLRNKTKTKTKTQHNTIQHKSFYNVNVHTKGNKPIRLWYADTPHLHFDERTLLVSLPPSRKRSMPRRPSAEIGNNNGVKKAPINQVCYVSQEACIVSNPPSYITCLYTKEKALLHIPLYLLWITVDARAAQISRCFRGNYRCLKARHDRRRS